MVLALDFYKERAMKFPRDPHNIIYKYGLAAILLVELFRFIKFIAG
jgi:hypothetical protein